MSGDCVTMPWLVGTGIAICAIIIPTILLWSRSKVNKETCIIIHENIDETLKKLCSRLDNVDRKMDTLSNSLTRIETLLTHSTPGASGGGKISARKEG